MENTQLKNSVDSSLLKSSWGRRVSCELSAYSLVLSINPSTGRLYALDATTRRPIWSKTGVIYANIQAILAGGELATRSPRVYFANYFNAVSLSRQIFLLFFEPQDPSGSNNELMNYSGIILSLDNYYQGRVQWRSVLPTRDQFFLLRGNSSISSKLSLDHFDRLNIHLQIDEKTYSFCLDAAFGFHINTELE